MTTDATAGPVDDRIPAAILTGFLGSGKTTFLNKLLKHPAMARTAILVNEFGDVGIDDLLIESVDGSTILMDSGCVCCTIRDSLATSIGDLLRRRDGGDIPSFDRLLIETTGLANPGPIVHTLMSDPLVFTRMRLDSVVTTVDAQNGMATLTAYREAVAQAAIADRLILTKTDLVSDDVRAELTVRLRDLNPAALLLHAADETAPELLLHAGLYDPAKRGIDLQTWINEDMFQPAHGAHKHVHEKGSRHDDRIGTFCLSIDTPLRWQHVAPWLDALAAETSGRLLRLKGILNIVEVAQPVIIHGVQGFFHPPGLLPEWPQDDDRHSRIVFVADDLDRTAIAQAMDAALGCNSMIAAVGRAAVSR